jgi:uridine phosphorylase
MLKELTRADWLAMLEIPEDRVPEVVILRGTRNLHRYREIYAARCSDVVEIGSPNGLFEDVFIGRHKSLNIGYASVYGDSMASEITHLFGVLGSKMVIQTGCCGALQPSVQTGDLIIPSAAIPGEGAAKYYLPDATKITVSTDMQRRAAALIRPCWPYHTGVMYTTSALLAEGDAELRAWAAAGYVAADMETATTFAVAKSFGMKRLSILFTFDNPLHGDTLIETDEERRQRRERGESSMFEVVTRLLDQIAEQGLD